jgi:glycosyltransferase involved in cell wall biosynthesis
MKTSFHIFANAALGKGLSGSDRIFIEFAKRLRKKYKVTIHVWREGHQICLAQDLRGGVDFKILNVDFWCRLGFVICYFARIIASIKESLFLKLNKKDKTIIYSASEFWMDSLPAFIIKIRYPNVIWIAAWFQTAPNPLVGFTVGVRDRAYKLSAFYYWFMQLPIKPLIEKFADYILINNEDEKKQFSKIDKLKVILGAVNIKDINEFQKSNKSKPKLYDAVFQGRFHPQKGVVELIDVWKLVTKEIPDAKLAMVGDGPLMQAVKDRIDLYKLENNITLFGYVFDGPEKYKIFSQSKIVVHPAFYDSGGMAAAEAMAFGLPCVGFNLESYKSYYPKGMIKAEIGDLTEFSNIIIELLNDKSYREKKGNEAKKMIFQDWNWENRISQLNILLK